MAKLIFICNELVGTVMKDAIKLPLEFISFAIMDGEMYKHYDESRTFTLPLGITKNWGNTKVYGAIFLCTNSNFYLTLIDAYHACSYSNIRRNHINDLHHRIETKATVISFNNLDELSRLKYIEGGDVRVIAYIGNINHSQIKNRLSTTQSHRVIDGIMSKQFKELYKGVV